MYDWYKTTYEFALKKLSSEELDFELEMTRLSEQSEACKTFYQAALESRRASIHENLRPTPFDNGSLRFTAHQAIKAACIGREDIQTTKTVQLAILQSLERQHLMVRMNLESSNLILKASLQNRFLISIAALLLLYIAIKV